MIESPKRTVLAVFAHPDDESFGTGGTLAYHAGNGTAVTLVCATRGEVGEISDPSLATPETLPLVREQELRCACQALGIDPPLFLGYRDSGMADTPENQNPQAYMNIPAGEVVPRLVRLIRRLRPQVVITFDPEGGYGHPDHIAVHHHTVAAFHAAADPALYPDLGEAWQADRLLYAVIVRSVFEEMRAQMEQAGLDTSDFDRFAEDDDGQPMGWLEEDVDFIVDVGPYVEAKWAALHCHRTQFGPDNPFRQIPEAQTKQLMRREHFALAWPESAKRDHPLADIFAGL